MDLLRRLSYNTDDRTLKARKNVFYMFFIKGASILTGLLLVPITIDYVDSEAYGIWLTLSSMIAWISFFDIGLSNGLKNRLAEAFALNDIELGRKYVSTTYALLAMIFIPLMFILLVVCPLVNWQSVLNISNVEGLLTSILIIVVYFCLNFILSTINIVIIADQRPADASLRSLLQQLVTIVIICILKVCTQGNLVKLCISLCAAPLLVVALFNITLFRGRYKNIAPSIKYIDFTKLPNLLNLGVKFFVIQIAGIVQFQMVNFLIMRNFGGGDVTAYNVANKYFGVVYMVWGILIAPIWAAVTDAKVQGDYKWIRSTMNKYIKLFIPFLLISGLMLALSPYFYKIWLGDSVAVTFTMSVLVMIYNIVLIWGSTFVMILNGLGVLNGQTVASILSPFVFLGICYLLINWNFGVYSIIIASILANFNGYLLAPIQCIKRLNVK